MPASLADLAERFDCELRGAGELIVDSVGTLASAGPSAVTFLANPLYRHQLAATNAAAVILGQDDAPECPVAALVSSNPYATYARIAAYLRPTTESQPGVHPSAIVADDAVISDTARIEAQAVIGPGSVLGDSAVVGPGCVVGANVHIGSDTRLFARAMVLDRVEIGARCLLHPGAVVGSDGFGFARDGEGWLKVPQLGSVIVGDDVEIGANTTIDRGTIDNTVIGDGVILDNLIQIGHNVRIGAHTAMAALCGISGSTEIGKRCLIAGAVVMVGHLTICDDVMVTFHSTVTRSISSPGTYSSGLPADEASRWRRNAARFRNLDEIVRRLSSLEQQLKALAERSEGRADD